ncbi:unnamed protein product [Clavelina lepadiformis]|uniref:Uncharacterized protein n=1 Tax=Clavelina lepadiformis TaxID=159417 RepID=A0ABP0G5G1_CLALP
MGNGCTSYKAVKLAETTTKLPKLKLVLVGESTGGKSSILERFEKNHFQDEYLPTKTVNIVSIVKKVNIPDQGIISLELWDVPDHERTDLRKSYYLNADAVIVVVDLADDENAFDNAVKWKHDVSSNLLHSRPVDKSTVVDHSNAARLDYFKPKPNAVPLLLLGNKFDVVKEAFLREQYSLYDATSSQAHNSAMRQGNNDITEDGTHPEEMNTTYPDLVNSTESGKVGEEEDNTEDVKGDTTPPAKSAEDVAEKEKPPVSGSCEDEHKEGANESTTVETPPDHASDETKPLLENGNLSDDGVSMEIDNPGHKSDNNNITDNPEPSVDGGGPDPPAASQDELEAEKPSTETQNGDESDVDEIHATEKKFKKLSPKDLFIHNQEMETLQEENKPKSLVTAQAKTKSLSTDGVSAPSIATTFMLPPCIEQLEKCAEEHGFIAGIPVSAKDAKGGIHEAMQSLIRHVVSKRHDTSTERKRKTDESTSMRSEFSQVKRTKNQQNHTSVNGFSQLREVGVIEIDEVLKKCNDVLREADNMNTAYRESIHIFKKACFQRQLIGSRQASIEECISAVKDSVESPSWTNNGTSDIRAKLLRAEAKPEFRLVTIEEEKFLNLSISSLSDRVGGRNNKNEIAPPSDLLFILGIYHEKVHKSCSNVMLSSEQLEEVLLQLHKQISAKEENAWDIAVASGLSQSNVKDIMACLARAKVRVKGTADQLKDTRRSVKATQAKIRATLLF